MENTTFLMLMLSSAALIAGICLHIIKPNLVLRLRGGICLVLAVQTFALAQIIETSGNSYPTTWVLLLALWPLLPAFVMHIMLVKYGPSLNLSIAWSKKLIYLPCLLFLFLGLIYPSHFYEITIEAGAGTALFPVLEGFTVKLQLIWLLLLTSMLLYYMFRKKINTSHLFSEVIIWCIPTAFLLLARFTCTIGPLGVIEMFWLPISIPIVGGFWHAFHHFKELQRLNANLASSISEIRIHTDEQGRILDASNRSLKSLGYNEAEMNNHHINHLFPDLRVNSTGKDMLTYMKVPDCRRIPVKVAVNSIPGNRGYLVTGYSVL